MDVLEELYQSYEFYEVLNFQDLQLLRDEDWLDVGEMKWNYSGQCYKNDAIDTLNVYRMGVKRMSLTSDNFYMFACMRNGVFYSHSGGYSTKNHRVIQFCGEKILRIYNVDKNSNYKFLRGSWVELYDFEGEKVVAARSVLIDGMKINMIEMTSDDILVEVDEDVVEAASRHNFRVSVYQEEPPKRLTLVDLPEYVQEWRPNDKLVENPPIYPQISLDRLVNDLEYRKEVLKIEF